MKKHLIAAAVAGALAVPAMAQVTVSGTLDVAAYKTGKSTDTIANTSTKTVGNADNRQDGWSTSQLVFSASEDLGGGLKATAVYSNRISDSALGEDRDRYIDLSGGFGGIRIGRFNSAISASYLGLSGIPTTSPAGNTYGLVVGGMGQGANTEGGNFERGTGNMIQYTTPNMSGIVATVGLRNSSTDVSGTTGKTKETQTQATLGYSAGPLALGLGFGKRENTVDNITGGDDADLMWVGGAYNLGMAKVHVTYGTREHEDTSGGGAAVKDMDLTLTTIGVSVPLGAVTLKGFVYDGKDDRAAAATDNVNLKGHQIAAQYAFSKRTFAYAVIGESKTTRSGAASTAAANETTNTHIGISHSF